MAAEVRPQLLPPKLRSLFFRKDSKGQVVYARSRYKVAHGGRSSGKSTGYARMAVTLADQMPLRFMCLREVQKSISASVHRLLSDTIETMGLSHRFEVHNESIRSHIGAEFMFHGIKTDPDKIKSAEGIDICFIEEAHKITEQSWKTLLPTIRGKEGRPFGTRPEVWMCFNPGLQDDPTYKRFVVAKPPDMRRVQMNWNDNPWFPESAELERRYALELIANAQDDDERLQYQADYDHVWDGHTMNRTDAAIFRRRVVVEEFDDPPPDRRLFLGADWGFANDPTALIKFWMNEAEDELFIGYELFSYRTEIDLLPDAWDRAIPDARKWPIKGDCSQPMIISYLARQGFNITPAEKWQGSVEDGIEHLKAFKKIHIHERCKKMQEEARLYQYKIDRTTSQVLPIVLDAWNHGWDSIRYGLDGYIQRRGTNAIWDKL